MATNPLATLSASGWVTEMSEKADKLMAYFFVSERSQSELYAGSVESLPWLVQEYGNNDIDIRREVQNSLMRILGRYFDSVNVSVDVDHPIPSDPTRLNVRVDATVVQGTYRYSVGKLISTLNSKVLSITNATK